MRQHGGPQAAVRAYQGCPAPHPRTACIKTAPYCNETAQTSAPKAPHTPFPHTGPRRRAAFCETAIPPPRAQQRTQTGRLPTCCRPAQARQLARFAVPPGGHQQGDKIGKVGKPQHAHQPRHGAPGAHRPARRARPGGHGAAQPGKGSGRGHAVKGDVGDKPHAPATLHKLRPNGAQQRRAQHCAHLRGQQKRGVCPGRARNTRAKRKLHPGRPLPWFGTPCACGYVHHTRRRRPKQPKRHKRRVDDAMHPNFGFRGNVFYVNTKALPFWAKTQRPMAAWRPPWGALCNWAMPGPSFFI